MEPRHKRVPKLLNDAKLPDESEEKYRERLKSNQEFLDDYLEGYPMDANAKPSTRVIKRLFQGKRSISSLKPTEKKRIRVVFGMDDNDLRTLVWFGTQTEIAENPEKYVA